MAVDIRVIRAGQMYRYYLRQTVVGDGRRPARTPLREAQEQAGVPVGRWMGRGLAALGLAPGEEVTEQQLRNLFGERGRHPYADRIEADLLAKGASAKKAFKAGALGRRVTVTGVDFVFRPQPTIYLLWALGDDETRRVIEAAHERAIERVLEWIENEVAVIRYGKDGIYRVRPPGGLVAARFRHYQARSGMPLLHDHLLLSVKGQRLDGKWGSVHTLALHENTVAASALYNELVAAEVCEELGLATEPRTVTPGRRPVMEIAGVPHELIRWTSRPSDQIAACLAELEHEYVTAVDDDGEPRFLPVVSERARAKLNAMAARKTRPPKQTARPLAQLRAWWKASAILTSGVAADVITSLLEYACAAAAVIRARVAAVVDVALAAVDVTATVFVMNDGGRFHRRHLLAEARRHLALVLRGRRRDLRLDDQVVAAAISTHCLDISEPTTVRDLEAGYRLYTARWALSDIPARRRSPTAAPDPDRHPPGGSWRAGCAPAAGPGRGGVGCPPHPIPVRPCRPRRCGGEGEAARHRGRRSAGPGVRRRRPSAGGDARAAAPARAGRPRARRPGAEARPPRGAGPGGAARPAGIPHGRRALDVTAERLRHLQDAFSEAADRAHTTMNRYTRRDDTETLHPVRRDDQQAYHPQDPGPHRGWEAGH
ncbi:MobF family relaxase [Streptomyces cyaneofuscatus]|uniref:MobF family relaxase n=1 Tax=Streptomyces cyaneofuscatus TaxID=66883 RepID=UPI003677DA9A